MFFNSPTLNTPVFYTPPKLTLKTGASFGLQPTKYRSGTDNTDLFTPSTERVPKPILETLKRHIPPPLAQELQPDAFLQHLQELQMLLKSGLFLGIANQKRVKIYLSTLYPSAIPSLLDSEAKILPSSCNNTALEKLEQQLTEANRLYVNLRQRAQDDSPTTRLANGRDFLISLINTLIEEIKLSPGLQVLHFTPAELHSLLEERISKPLAMRSVSEQINYLNYLQCMHKKCNTPTPIGTINHKNQLCSILSNKFDYSGELRLYEDQIRKAEQEMLLEIPIQAYLQWDLVEARKVARSLGILPEFEKANTQWFYRRLLDNRDYPFNPSASLKKKILAIAQEQETKVEGITPEIKTRLFDNEYYYKIASTDEKAKIIELLTPVFAKEEIQVQLLRTMWYDSRPKPIAIHGEDATVVHLLRSALASKELQAVTQAINYIKDANNAVNIEALLRDLGHKSK